MCVCVCARARVRVCASGLQEIYHFSQFHTKCVVHVVAHACVLFIGGFQCESPMPV